MLFYVKFLCSYFIMIGKKGEFIVVYVLRLEDILFKVIIFVYIEIVVRDGMFRSKFWIGLFS